MMSHPVCIDPWWLVLAALVYLDLLFASSRKGR
jgi:hypothetical protein